MRGRGVGGPLGMGEEGSKGSAEVGNGGRYAGDEGGVVLLTSVRRGSVEAASQGRWCRVFIGVHLRDQHVHAGTSAGSRFVVPVAGCDRLPAFRLQP